MKTAFELLPPEKQAEVRRIASETADAYGFSEKERAALAYLLGMPAERTNDAR